MMLIAAVVLVILILGLVVVLTGRSDE